MQDILYGLRHYADFKGRCTRKPFWIFLSTTQVFLLLLATPLLMALTETTVYMLTENEELFGIMEEIADSGEVTEDQVRELLGGLGCHLDEMLILLFRDHGVAMVMAGLSVLLGLALFVPTLSITVRRLRDAGQSPWWVYASLLMFIPLPGIGELGTLLGLVVFILCWLPSVKASELPPVPSTEGDTQA